jgi:TPR repeat protein
VLPFLLSALASAESLPGINLPFRVTANDEWVLSESLPEEFSLRGVEPGWVLVQVDGRDFTTGGDARRHIASGSARDVQLRFHIPPPDTASTPEEVILLVRRVSMVSVSELGLLPWPEGFTPRDWTWGETWGGLPTLTDTSGGSWVLDIATGAQTPFTGDRFGERVIPEVWWTLSNRQWVMVSDEGVQGGDAAYIKELLPGAVRVEGFQGQLGDHLIVPSSEGLQILSVTWPWGTPNLPGCAPSIPETCLTAGRTVQSDLGNLPGGSAEALRLLSVACEGGVHRGCYDAVALESPELAARANACVEGDVSACHETARARLKVEPEIPGPLAMGLLEFSCEMDSAGSLGERLRRLEDAGEGCMMLSAAFDRRNNNARALLSLDQACVLGRADACTESERRRHEAFAMRTVDECESIGVPVASSCVELGVILQGESVAATGLDAFSAFLRGCTLGAEDGCILLGDYVDRWGIENERVVQAEQDLMGACDTEQRACVGAAHLLVRHEPRSEAYADALTMFTSACEAGLPGACVAGARQRRIGKARRVEAPTQLEMWEQACTLHSAPGCSGLGEVLARNKSTWPDAFSAWGQACNTGDAHACTELGLLVENRHKEPWPDEQPVNDYLTQGCENGDAEGCYWLAEEGLVRREEPAESTYMLLERSCEGDFGQGCADLADVHLRRATSFDDEIAANHLVTACDNGHFESCRILGNMYLRGKGVERDRQKAKELSEQFQFNATRRHVRLGVQVGFPYGIAGAAEVVLPIPVGPALSFAGSGTYVPYLGNAMMGLDGLDVPSENYPALYYDGVVRLYPNTKARGIYGGMGWHNIQGDIAGELVRKGASGRFGIYTENKSVFTRVEMGIGYYGPVELSNFDEDKDGTFPLVQPTFGFTVGAALF